MARPELASRTPLSTPSRPPSRQDLNDGALPGLISWIPELLAIGGLVAVIALLVGALS